jgi:predicted  nucleic acid-binding Zn-ribbon protein
MASSKEGMSAATDSNAYSALVQEIYSHLSVLSAKEDALISCDRKEHNTEEEEKDLPPTEEKLSKQESEDAAAKFERAKKFAPTR